MATPSMLWPQGGANPNANNLITNGNVPGNPGFQGGPVGGFGFQHPIEQYSGCGSNKIVAPEGFSGTEAPSTLTSYEPGRPIRDSRVRKAHPEDIIAEAKKMDNNMAKIHAICDGLNPDTDCERIYKMYLGARLLMDSIISEHEQSAPHTG
jgi:hypothetical protein